MSRRTGLALLFTVVIAVAATPALAGKGGNGNGNGGNGNGNGHSTSAPSWVSASPNPAAAGGERVEVTGCGFDVSYPVELRIIHSAGYTEAYAVGVWYTGCMNPTPIFTSEAGTYRIEVYQRNSRESTLQATTSLSVG